jgi:hypothetical protein
MVPFRERPFRMVDQDPEPDLSVPERKFLELYMELGNATEAAMQVYNCSSRASAASMGYTVLRRHPEAVRALMERRGLDMGTLMQKVHEGLDAEVVVVAKHQGKLGEEKAYPDFATRQRYADMVLKLTGSYAPERHELSGPDGQPMVYHTTYEVYSADSDAEPAPRDPGADNAAAEAG